ncbi:MAG: EamA family transporter [Pseudomonadales bacterium]|nr:EamA family transporter [Pseudomonadales bacterium]
MNTNQRSLLMLHASVFIFGITALFSKLIPLSSADINLVRSILTVLVLGVLLKVQRRPIKLLSNKDLAWMIFLGALLGLHWLTYFHAMKVSSVAVGVISLYTFPLMVVFLEPLLSKEKLHLSDALLALVGLGGVFLMVPTFSLDSPITAGVAWGLISALFFALRNIWQKQRLSEYRGDTTMLYQGFVAGLTCLPFISFTMADINFDNAWKLLVIGTLLTALPHSLFVTSLRHLRAKTASLIACMQPVHATILALIFLNEQPTAGTLIGGTLIIASSMIETYRTK